MTTARDLNIWQELEPMENGYVPARPRRWMFVGISRGEKCRIPCELEAKHPTLPDTYIATAVFSHNVHFLCRQWVRLDQLEAVA
jgi:hypothetical protein